MVRYIEEEPTATMEYRTVGISNTVRSVLVKANREQRITVGLNESLQVLRRRPEEHLFCLLASPQTNNDYTSHILEVLLQAFCLENDIYIIKVSFI